MIATRILNCATWARQLTIRSLSTAIKHQNVATRCNFNFGKDLQPVKFCIPINLSLQKPMKRIEDVPLHNEIIENPRSKMIHEIEEIIKNNNALEAPPTFNPVAEIQAARLIVIRRRKMKKHKLRKLRKKMKFEWAKVRQRREMRKEKAFQAELLAQIREAEKFSAEEYVNEKLRKANETPIPRYWKGRRLPQFIIKQKLGIE